MLKIRLLRVVALLSSVFIATFGKEIAKREIAAAVVPEPKVAGVLGHAVNISCISVNNYALRSCRWERTDLADGKRYVVNINSHGINGSDSSNCANCKYDYVGKGLQEGDCTISIKNATEFHAGNWECLLFGKPVEHTWIGHLSVELNQFAIGEPCFCENEHDLNNIIYDEASPKIHNLSCCVDVPSRIPIHLRINYGNETIPSFDLKEPGINIRACTVATYQFLPQNSCKFLTCSVRYSYQAQEYVKKASIQIDVKFGPQISINSPVQYRNDSNAFVTFEYSANPKPVLRWLLTTDVDNDEDSYFEIKDSIKYAMAYEALKDDNYIATLKVKNVNEDDCKRQFKLRISNDYGTKELPFKIVTPNPGDESDAYWMMILIGIGAVIFCLIFFIVLFIILSKRNTSGTYVPAPVG